MREKQLRKKIIKYWKLLHFYRVENLMCEPGMPDIFFINKNKITGWIELKKIQSINCKIDFQPMQPFWIDDYITHGGNAFVLVFIVKTKEYFLINGENILQYFNNKLKIIPYLLKSQNILEIEKELLVWPKIQI